MFLSFRRSPVWALEDNSGFQVSCLVESTTMSRLGNQVDPAEPMTSSPTEALSRLGAFGVDCHGRRSPPGLGDVCLRPPVQSAMYMYSYCMNKCDK
jgi:hypothetical protein